MMLKVALNKTFQESWKVFLLLESRKSETNRCHLNQLKTLENLARYLIYIDR